MNNPVDQPKVSELTLSAALKLWREHGGSTFGPRIEHVSMKERDFLGFCKALVAQPQATTVGVTSTMVQAVMDSLFGEYTSPGNDQAWITPDWMEAKAKVRTALEAALIGIPGAEKGEADIDAMIEELATSFREEYELASGQTLNWQCVYEALKATAQPLYAAPTSERVQALEDARGIDPDIIEACAKHADGCYADARLAAAIRALKATP